MPTDNVSLDPTAQVGRHFAPLISLPGFPGEARCLATEIRNSALHCVGQMPGRFLRGSLYRMFGVKLARGARIAPGCWVLGGPSRISIGAGSIINRGVVLDGRFPLIVGENASISIQTIILTLEHDLSAADFRAVGAPVVIGDRVFIGARAIVLPGITISEGGAVAAGAVVTRDVEPYTIVAGVPARVIGTRPRNLTYHF